MRDISERCWRGRARPFHLSHGVHFTSRAYVSILGLAELHDPPKYTRRRFWCVCVKCDNASNLVCFLFVWLVSDSCLIVQPQLRSFDWLENKFLKNLIKNYQQDCSHYMLLFVFFCWSYLIKYLTAGKGNEAICVLNSCAGHLISQFLDAAGQNYLFNIISGQCLSHTYIRDKQRKTKPKRPHCPVKPGTTGKAAELSISLKTW